MTESSPGTASFDSRDAQRGEGREMGKNSKLLGHDIIFKQPQPNAPKVDGEID